MSIEGIGILMGLAGTGGLGYGVMQTLRAGRLAKTPHVKTHDAATRGDSVAGDRGAISVEGDVICDEPILSPVTGTPCLYFRLEVTGSWKDGDKKHEKTYVDEKHAATFFIDDGSGKVEIEASEGGDFPLEKKFDAEKKEGFMADLRSVVGKSTAMQFGNYTFQNPAGSVADRFRCVEYVMPVAPRLFAAGRADGGRIHSPKWAQLILATGTRDALLGKAMTHKKYAFIGGGSVGGVGVAMAIVGAMLAPPKKPAAAAIPPAAITAPAEVEPAPAPAPVEDEPVAKTKKHHGRKAH